MADPEKVHVVGIGDDGLEGMTASTHGLIDEADVLIGSEKSLGLIPETGAERIQIGNDLSVLPGYVSRNENRKVVVLASGDPLFYGVARFLCDRLGKERFEVVPHVSSMQLAFARVKESWEEAYLTNLANQSLEHVVEKIRTAGKAGLFTTEMCPPSAVAQALVDRKIDYFSVFVCENLGSPDERVTHAELDEVIRQQFAPLNVMILVRKPNSPDRPAEMIGRRLFGNPDEAFLQSQPKRGLLTPAEVRTLALSALDLGPTSIIWDVGAGSGSVAIEAAQIAAGGCAYAIEKDAEDLQLISANAERFGTENLVPVLGEAPEAWVDLPDPDAIFVSGAGQGVRRITELAFQRLRSGGRLVANVGSIENLAAVHEVLYATGEDVRVWMVNISHGTHQLERIRFESMNPTFLIGVTNSHPGSS